MTKDRAAIVATALIAVARRALRDPALEREFAAVLRQEFRDIEQQVLTETRAENPHEITPNRKDQNHG